MAGENTATGIVLTDEQKSWLAEQERVKQEQAVIQKGVSGGFGVSGEQFKIIAEHPEFKRLTKLTGLREEKIPDVAAEVLKVMQDEAKHKGEADKQKAERERLAAEAAARGSIAANNGGNGGGADKVVDWNNLDKEELAKLPPAQRMLAEGIARHKKTP